MPPRSLVLSRHRVRVGDDVVPYEVVGEGEPVIMVHGLGGSSRCWAPTLPALASRYRVFLVDLPGFGRLRRLHRRFTLDTAASWLRAWLRAADVGRAHLIGHSMGAFISAQIAAASPELVDRLVLVSAAGIPTGRSLADCIRRVPGGWRHRAPGTWRLVLIDALLTRPSVVMRTARALLTQDLRTTLAEIRAPTLVVWGADDPMMPVECAAAFRNGIPGARALLLPRAGHLPMISRPEEFNRALRSFLAGEPVGE
jgi:pimeloyl-ACP methyl ester carboxylesterase